MEQCNCPVLRSRGELSLPRTNVLRPSKQLGAKVPCHNDPTNDNDLNDDIYESSRCNLIPVRAYPRIRDKESHRNHSDDSQPDYIANTTNTQLA
jgi:hypothetical protein